MADRISQGPVEVAIEPTSQKARVSQEPVEVAIEPTSQKARVSQFAVEVAIGAVIVGGSGARSWAQIVG